MQNANSQIQTQSDFFAAYQNLTQQQAEQYAQQMTIQTIKALELEDENKDADQIRESNKKQKKI